MPRIETQPQADFAAEYAWSRTGGAERDRTADPLLAKQVLSQLSYSPTPPSSYAGRCDKGGGPG